MKVWKSLFGFCVVVVVGFSVESVFASSGELTGQAPAKQWEWSLGSTLSGEAGSPAALDWILSIRQLRDGGYIAAGFVERECGRYVCGEYFSRQQNPAIFRMNSRGELMWQKVYDGGSRCQFGIFRGVIETDEGFAAVGEQAKDPDLADCDTKVYFVRMNGEGEPIQEEFIGLTTARLDDSRGLGTSLIQTPDGGFALTGGMSRPKLVDHPQTHFPADFFLLKLDADGRRQWMRLLGGHHEEIAFGLTSVTKAGRHNGFLLAGHRKNEVDQDVYLVRTNARGKMRWEQIIDSSALPDTLYEKKVFDRGPEECAPPEGFAGSIDSAFNVIEIDDDEFIVGAGFNLLHRPLPGCTANPGKPDEANFAEYRDVDAVLIKLRDDRDAEGLERVEFIENVAHCSGEDFFTRALLLEDGGFAMTCSTGDPGVKTSTQQDFLITRTDNAGKRLWRKAFSGPGEQSCSFGADTTSDGGFVVGGNNEDFKDDYVVVKLAAECQANAEYDIDSPVEILGREVWREPLRIGSQITVGPGGTLVIEGPEAVIEFADVLQLEDFDDVRDVAGIRVLPGGRLVVEQGARLTALTACSGEGDGRWAGIEVHGDPSRPQVPASNQGSVVIRNGAVIERARVGIRLDRTVYNDGPKPFPAADAGGGIVTIDSAHFRDNAVAIDFGPYVGREAEPGNVGRIAFSTFTRSASDRTPLPPCPEEGCAFVRIRGAHSLALFGNTFGDGEDVSETRASMTGVLLEGGSVAIGGICSGDFDDPQGPCIVGPANHFVGLEYGVRGLFEEGGATAGIDLVGTRLLGVQTGVLMEGPGALRIVGSHFESMRDRQSVGVRSRGARRVSIAASTFVGNGQGGGVRIEAAEAENDTNAHRIVDNFFEGLAQALVLEGGLKDPVVTRNRFRATGRGVVVRSGFGGRVRSLGHECSVKGGRADNLFLDECGQGVIHLFATDEFSYYQSANNPHPASSRCSEGPIKIESCRASYASGADSPSVSIVMPSVGGTAETWSWMIFQTPSFLP